MRVTSRVVRPADLRVLRRESSCWHVADAVFFYILILLLLRLGNELCLLLETCPDRPT